MISPKLIRIFVSNSEQLRIMTVVAGALLSRRFIRISKFYNHFVSQHGSRIILSLWFTSPMFLFIFYCKCTLTEDLHHKNSLISISIQKHYNSFVRTKKDKIKCTHAYTLIIIGEQYKNYNCAHYRVYYDSWVTGERVVWALYANRMQIKKRVMELNLIGYTKPDVHINVRISVLYLDLFPPNS